MKKLLVTTLVMALVIVLGASHVMALNPRVASTKASTLKNYSLLKKKAFDVAEAYSSGKGETSVSLGAYAADGGSPGYIITRTWRDDQNHAGVGRMVDWRGTPQVHFIFVNQICAGNTNPESCGRWIHYNMFNPAVSPVGCGLRSQRSLASEQSADRGWFVCQHGCGR